MGTGTTLQMYMCVKNTHDHECTRAHRTSVSLHNFCSNSVLNGKNNIAQATKIAKHVLLIMVPAHQKVAGSLSELSLTKRYLPIFLILED